LYALALALSVALLPAAASAFSSGSSSSSATKSKSKSAQPAVEANYAKGVKAVDKKDWNLAVFHLHKAAAADPTSADARNWLGYSYRKLKDFDNAFVFYNEALNLDPRHKGAHEYIGEAYLETGNLAQAEAHLAALAKLCPKGCEELDELKEKVDQFKARS
jgi:Flp pilus assembly protein TadD